MQIAKDDALAVERGKRATPVADIAWPDAAQLAPLAARGIDRTRLWLRALVLLAAVLALAGPRIPIPGDRLESEGIALMLVVDVSATSAAISAGEGSKVFVEASLAASDTARTGLTR